MGRETPRRLASLLLALGLAGLGLGSLGSCHGPVAEKAEAPAAGPRYGTLMAEVGRRFERLGRAAIAHRWELAGFELGELDEAFEDLRAARPPHDVLPEALRSFEKSYASAPLRSALAARDIAAVTSAYATMAAGCNGCHLATAHGFIEVPTQPGAEVPRMDPVP